MCSTTRPSSSTSDTIQNLSTVYEYFSPCCDALTFCARGPGWVLRGKTGLTEQGDRAVGWLVGILEEGERSYLYATLVLAGAEDLERVIPLRAALTRALLQRHGHPLASTG